jgi:DMSO/TMAO reductase YedYZ heme-binding membrane subunit
MSAWGTVTWDVARAGGFTAYVLLTLSVALGLMLTMQWQSAGRWPRLINSELHNFLTLLSLIFVGVHVLAVWLDPFTRFGWSEVFIPFVSHYRPLWMALGIVALYLGLAIGLSTWLRPLIGYEWWRRLHVLTLVCYGLVTVHGIATGSDTRTWWAVLIYLGSALAIGAMLLFRLLEPATPRGRAHPVWASLVAGTLVVGGFWTLLGPLQSGWNASANNGNGSGARIAIANTTTTPTAGSSGNASSANASAFSSAFSAQVRGRFSQRGPDGNGTVLYEIQGTLQNGAAGLLDVRLSGQDDGSGSVSITSTQVTLGPSDNPTLYTGQVTQLQSDGYRWNIAATLTESGAASQTLGITLSLRVSNSAASGSIQGTPGGAGGGA